ncbi:MAG: hypothetical protein ACODAJ_12200 [Planctomycetota bacterium]
MKLAGPMLDDDDPTPVELAIFLAAVAWNMAGFGEEKRRSELRRVSRDMAPEDFDLRVRVRQTVKDLIRRKLDLFPDDDRYIVDYEVVPISDRFHVNVVFGVPDPPPPSAEGEAGEETR